MFNTVSIFLGKKRRGFKRQETERSGKEGRREGAWGQDQEYQSARNKKNQPLKDYNKYHDRRDMNIKNIVTPEGLWKEVFATQYWLHPSDWKISLMNL